MGDDTGFKSSVECTAFFSVSLMTSWIIVVG